MELNVNAVKALLDAFDESDWQEMTVTVGSDTLHVSRRPTANGASGDAGAAHAAALPARADAPAAVAPAAGGGTAATPLAAGDAAAAAAPAAAEGTAAAPAAGGRGTAVAAPAPGETTANGGGPAGSAGGAATADGTVVTSPSVGLLWRAPSPGAPPFVEVGTTVAAGDTVAIVEVMKLMNHVTAPVDGVVTAILVENGATVEYGQPLVTIDPA